MSVFGPYRDLRRIAVGGMAEVYRARDSRSGNLVALKVLLPHASRDTELQAGLFREARLQQRLRHDNLMAVRDHGVVDGVGFIALEYVDGPTLATVLARQRLTVATSVEIGVGILSALAHAHAASDEHGHSLDIVHRDISPHNIMLRLDGVVKLGDFGIARSGDAARTRTGFVKGKLGYLAPEQVTQSTLDARTDVYQVGLVLFEMLCGEPYLAGDGEIELLRAAEAPAVRLPSAHGAPTWLDAVVGRALKRFPEERYASAAHFLRELTALRERAGTPDLDFLRTFAPAEGAPLLSAARPRKRSSTIVMLGALAVGTLALGGTALWQRRQAAVAAETTPTTALPVTPSAPAIADPPSAHRAASPPGPAPAPKKVVRPPRAETVAKGPEPEKVVPSNGPTPTLATAELDAALARLQKRTIGMADLPPALRKEAQQARQRLASEPTAPADDSTRALCAALDAVTVDRAFVERKLTRLQSAIAALPANDPRRAALTQLSRDTLQTLLDGNVAATNASLVAIERTLVP